MELLMCCHSWHPSSKHAINMLDLILFAGLASCSALDIDAKNYCQACHQSLQYTSNQS